MTTTWPEILKEEISKKYFRTLKKKLARDYRRTTCYPPLQRIFRVFKIPYDDIKVVIIGLTPYRQPEHANGYAFGVANTIMRNPPTLTNIFIEVERDVGKRPFDSTLKFWANQGVFLLNLQLTIRAKKQRSHKNFGWDQYTDFVLKSLDSKTDPIVFMLWGKEIQKKKGLLTNPRHLILETSYPSPFSVRRGFLGCHHFSKANEFLSRERDCEISWA